ncbi:MAG: class I SAM-dependent methyltransferase, partial [Litorivicinus sp.]
MWPPHWRPPEAGEAHLCWDGERYVGIHAALKQPLRIDFGSGDLARRARQGGEMLAKAVAATKRLHVVDATAGLGRDAFLMHAAGARVTAIESSPVLGFWLARNADGTGLTVIEGDAQAHLSMLAPDAVYLDPMFPGRDKSAAVKKEMAAFQELVGGDDDAGELLDAAL